MNESRKPDAADDPRVRYAIERTLLAWVRTGLSLMGLGFVVARFGLFLHEIEAVRQDAMPTASTGLSLWIGVALILLGVTVNLLVAAEHLRLMRQIQSLPPYGVEAGCWVSESHWFWEFLVLRWQFTWFSLVTRPPAFLETLA
jgi:putative membrane protein